MCAHAPNFVFMDYLSISFRYVNDNGKKLAQMSQ